MELRLASAADADALLELRNDPDVRRESFTTTEVDSAGHAHWLRDRLGRDHTRIYVAEADGAFVGQGRVEDGEISVAIAAPFRGRGLGAKLIRMVSDRAAIELGLGEIVARVKTGNAASLAAFAAAGYERDERASTGDVAVLVWRG